MRKFCTLMACVFGCGVFHQSAVAQEDSRYDGFGSITSMVIQQVYTPTYLVTGTVTSNASLPAEEEDPWYYQSSFYIESAGCGSESAAEYLEPGWTATWTVSSYAESPESVGTLFANLSVTPFASYDPDPEGINSWITIDTDQTDP